MICVRDKVHDFLSQGWHNRIWALSVTVNILLFWDKGLCQFDSITSESLPISYQYQRGQIGLSNKFLVLPRAGLMHAVCTRSPAVAKVGRPYRLHVGPICELVKASVRLAVAERKRFPRVTTVLCTL